MQSFDVVLTENNFIGMNDRLPSHELPSGVFQLLDNALIADDRIIKRPGNSGSTAIAGSHAMLGGAAFEPNGGTKCQIICLDGASNSQLYRSTDGVTFNTLGAADLAAGALMNFVQASNYLLGFNGTDVIDYDGTTRTRNRVGIPVGKFAFYFHNYLFVAGVSANPNRLYWSDLGAPTAFTGANFIDINANDGDSITGISIFNDQLMVFKNNSVWAIGGFSGATFSATTIAGQNTNSLVFGFGTPSHRSIVVAGKYLYYLAFVGGIPHIRVLQRTLYGNTIDGGIVSYEMEGTLKSINLTQLSRVAGIFDGKYCYWAFPNSSNTTNNLVLVLWNEKTFQTSRGPMRSWVKWSSGLTPDTFFISTISGRAKLYWSDASTTGKVFLIDSSVNTDNGTAIVMDAKSRDIMGPQSAKKIKWKYMYHRYKSGSAGTLAINARIDQASDFSLQESVSLAGSSPGLGPTGTFTLGVSQLGGSTIVKNRVTFAHLTGTLLGVQFKESTANSCELYDYSIFGFYRGLRDD